MIGGLLTLINNGIAILSFGIGQMLIVPFTTPFAFAIARLLFPRLPAATLVYTPLVFVSVITFNLGPPGPYKLVFLVAPMLVDLFGYLVGVHLHSIENPAPTWKLLVTFTPYPFGLLAGAWLALKFFGFTLPLMENFNKAMLGVAVLWGFGAIATWVACIVFRRTLRREILD